MEEGEKRKRKGEGGEGEGEGREIWSEDGEKERDRVKCDGYAFVEPSSLSRLENVHFPHVKKKDESKGTKKYYALAW